MKATKVMYETRVAAGVLGQRPKLIRQEFDRVLGRQNRPEGRRWLGFRDVLYFQLKKELELEGLNVDPDERQQLYWALSKRQSATGPWRRVGMRLQRSGLVAVTFDLGPIARLSSRQLRAYRRGQLQVVQDPAICGGAPVFKGTRIPVEQVVEQLRSGVPMEEIQEDFPSLSETALLYADLLSRMEKEPGRPRKQLQMRRMADEAAD